MKRLAATPANAAFSRQSKKYINAEKAMIAASPKATRPIMNNERPSQ